MTEPYIYNHSSDLPSAGSGPIFIFHGDVHGFIYSANPQGNVIGSMVNSAPSTSPSGAPWSESLRRRNTSHAQSSSTASSQTSLNPRSVPSVFIPPPSGLSSSFEGNQDAESITSFHSTPTVYYDFESSGGVEGASITSNPAGDPTGDPTNLIEESGKGGSYGGFFNSADKMHRDYSY